MEWFAHSQDFQSQVRVKTLLAGLSGEAVVSTKQIGQGHRTAGRPMSVAGPYLCLCVGKIFRNRESRDDAEKEKEM